MIAVMAVAAITASAQKIEPKKWYVGGQIEVDNVVDGATKYAFLPTIGCNITEKFGLGMEIGVQNIEGNAVVINPYIRYTFAKCGRVDFFADGEFGFAFNQGYTDYKIGIKPGISIDVCKCIAIEAKTNLLSWSRETAYHINTIKFLGKTTALDLGVFYKF